MATKEEIERELENRINADLRHFNGDLPERYAVAWNGYLAGLYEWGVIERYNHLLNLLPPLGKPDPVAEILEGRDED